MHQVLKYHKFCFTMNCSLNMKHDMEHMTSCTHSTHSFSDYSNVLTFLNSSILFVYKPITAEMRLGCIPWQQTNKTHIQQLITLTSRTIDCRIYNNNAVNLGNKKINVHFKNCITYDTPFYQQLFWNLHIYNFYNLSLILFCFIIKLLIVLLIIQINKQISNQQKSEID